MANRLKAEKTALLIVDMVNSCSDQRCEIPKWGVTFRKIRAMAPKLAGFVDAYRDAGGKVIFITCVPWRKEHLAKNIVELYKDPLARYYTKDTSGFAERFYLLKPNRRDRVFSKNTYDAFTNPRLRRYLAQAKITTIAVTGIFGDGCVNATINGGFSAGHNLILLKDLIETTDSPRRQRLQKILKERMWPQMYGKTIESREFLRRLG